MANLPSGGRFGWAYGICLSLGAVVLALGPGATASTGGTELWVKRYNGPADDYDVASSLAASPDGSKVFVTGYSPGATSGLDYATVAYDASTGAPLWVRRYNGPANSDDTARSVAASPDGSKVFVTGGSGNTSGRDYATVAYDASTGATLWVKRYNGPANVGDYAFSVAASPDGSKVFVTGNSYGATSSADYGTVAYDASTGATLWVKRYNGPGNDYDTARSVSASPDGSKVFVTGYSVGTSDSGYATVAYDASTGAPLWVKRYNNSSGTAFSVAASPDGSKVFVTGSSLGTTSSRDYATVAYDASTGATLWVRHYNGPGNGDDYASSVAASPDGSKAFVTGYSSGATSGLDYATVAYDASTGAPLWVRRYKGSTNSTDYAYSVAASPDGSKVFVTGYSYGATSAYDYATVAYDASTGAPLWVRRYNGPGNGDDYGSSVAASPDGSTVFVTGYSSGATSGLDYATVAYEA